MATPSEVLAQLQSHTIVPVIVVDEPEQADPLAAAMVNGGLPVAEVTFRTAAAPGAIARMAERGDMIVGAGTVLTPEHVDQAVEAGATFVVSPGLSRAVVERAQEHGILTLPGAVTATEIQAALELGLDTVKFFPAGTSGGAKAIKNLAAPFVGLSFIPTGGISPANLAEYLEIPQIRAVGGSWMAPRAAVNEGRFSDIEKLCAEAVELAASLRPKA